MATKTSDLSAVLPVADLARTPDTLHLSASAEERAAIAERFDLLGLERLEATLEPRRWQGGVRIDGRIVADALRRCVVTLEPVPEAIDERFARGFLPAHRLEEAESGAETELVLDPDLDDAPEALGDRIDLGEIAIEALGLALDPYPRAPDAPPLEARAAPPGETPMRDADTKPFASLAAWRAARDGGEPGE